MRIRLRGLLCRVRRTRRGRRERIGLTERLGFVYPDNAQDDGDEDRDEEDSKDQGSNCHIVSHPSFLVSADYNRRERS